MLINKLLKSFNVLLFYKDANRMNKVAGFLSYQYNLDVNEISEKSQLCFNNTQGFLGGEYREWQCQLPFPIGRNVILLVQEVNYMNFHDLIVYGTEMTDCQFEKISFNKISSTILSFKNSILNRMIDDNPLNTFQPSCSGFKDTIDQNITVSFQQEYIIYKIGLMTSTQSGNLYCFFLNFLSLFIYLLKVNYKVLTSKYSLIQWILEIKYVILLTIKLIQT